MREWNIGENSDDHRRPNLTIFLKKNLWLFIKGLPVWLLAKYRFHFAKFLCYWAIVRC